MIIITPVGVSSFLNAIKSKSDSKLGDAFDDLPKENGLEYCNDEAKTKAIKEQLIGFFKREFRNNDINKTCAELASLNKILAKLDLSKTEINIHLLATDTAASIIAAKAIKFWLESDEAKGCGHFKGKTLKIIFDDKENGVIKGLTVNSAAEFENKGADALLSRLLEIIDEENEERKKHKRKKKEIRINITGGYKVLTPWFTLFAQLNGIKLQYLYEEDDDNGKDNLLEVNKLPINFDFELLEFLIPYLSEVQLKNNPVERGFASSEICSRMESLKLIRKIDKTNNYNLSAIGHLMAKSAQSISRGKGPLGHVMELKLAYYYLLKKYEDLKKNPYSFSERGKKINPPHPNDIDLLFKNDEKEYILGEVKAISSVRKELVIEGEEKKKELYEKMEGRLSDFNTKENGQVNEQVLFVYHPAYENVAVIKDYVNEMNSFFLEKHPKIPFRIFAIKLAININDSNTNYTKIFNSNLDKNDIKEVTSELIEEVTNDLIENKK